MVATPMALGVVPLASLDVDRLDVRCTRCSRRGRYRVAALLVKHGADIGLRALASLLAVDCQQRLATDLSKRCDLYYPQLIDGSDSNNNA